MNESPHSRQVDGGYWAREANLDSDAALIAALWSANLAGHDLQSANYKLTLGYRDNPVAGATVLLLMLQGEQQAQGAQGLHARRFWLGRRPLRAAGMADFVVNVAHRSLLPALILLRQCAQVAADRFELVYGFPNAKAKGVCARGGLRQFGHILRYARPLSARTFLARHMPAWLAWTTAMLVVDPAFRLREGLQRRLASERLVCKPADWNHPAIDSLWSRRAETLLLCERTRAMLRWRFAAAGRGGWRLCLATDSANIEQGYVVWRNHHGLAEVGDFFSAEPERWTAPLLLAFAKVARAGGMRSISAEFFGSSKVVEQIRQAGLRPRSGGRSVFTSKALPREIEEPECWYMTGFDDDDDSYPRPWTAR